MNEFREQINRGENLTYLNYSIVEYTLHNIDLFWGIVQLKKNRFILCLTSIQIRSEVANIYKKVDNFFVLIVNKYNIFRKH